MTDLVSCIEVRVLESLFPYVDMLNQVSQHQRHRFRFIILRRQSVALDYQLGPAWMACRANMDVLRKEQAN